MRIFQVVERSVNGAIAGNSVWHRNLYESLVDMGHDVVLVDPIEGQRAMQRHDSALRSAFSERLLRRFRAEHAKQPFDLVFTYLMDGMVNPGVIDAMRATGVPTCNFSCNNVHQFGLVDDLSPHFDYSLHSERDTGAKFTAVGARPIWFQMAANPRYYAPKDVPRSVDAAFVGMNYALRAQYLFHLLANGIDVQVYGPGWRPERGKRSPWIRRQYHLLRAMIAPKLASQVRYSATAAHDDLMRQFWARFDQNLHPPLTDDPMIAIYSASKVSLGFLEVYDSHDPSGSVLQHLHLREFEAPMAGALYITNYSDELAEHYEPDREVLTFRNKHELLEKVRYYRDHPAEAQVIRDAGRARALRDHTWQRRFESLFAAIGLRDGARAAR